VGGLRRSIWLFALWAIVLYVFFAMVASIAPANVIALTVVMSVLAVLLLLRSLRVAAELADRGGDPSVRRELNRQRERRGF
jgi:EamA domain-containing membrane protein RarD